MYVVTSPFVGNYKAQELFSYVAAGQKSSSFIIALLLDLLLTKSVANNVDWSFVVLHCNLVLSVPSIYACIY